MGGDAVHGTICVLKRGKGSSIISTSWEPISSLPKVHSLSSAVSLGNKIIVIGGNDGKRCRHKTVSIGTLQ